MPPPTWPARRSALPPDAPADAPWFLCRPRLPRGPGFPRPVTAARSPAGPSRCRTGAYLPTTCRASRGWVRSLQAITVEEQARLIAARRRERETLLAVDPAVGPSSTRSWRVARSTARSSSSSPTTASPRRASMGRQAMCTPRPAFARPWWCVRLDVDAHGRRARRRRRPGPDDHGAREHDDGGHADALGRAESPRGVGR